MPRTFFYVLGPSPWRWPGLRGRPPGGRYPALFLAQALGPIRAVRARGADRRRRRPNRRRLRRRQPVGAGSESGPAATPGYRPMRQHRCVAKKARGPQEKPRREKERRPTRRRFGSREPSRILPVRPRGWASATSRSFGVRRLASFHRALLPQHLQCFLQRVGPIPKVGRGKPAGQ